MKERELIANSSSSSFVVAFPKKVKTLSDVREFIHREDQALQVFKDIMAQRGLVVDPERPNYIHKIILKLAPVYESMAAIKIYDKYKSLCDFSPENRDEQILKENSEIKELSLTLAEKFVTKNPKSVIYIFEYSDNDGEFYSEMEHDEIFYKLPHERINNH